MPGWYPDPAGTPGQFRYWDGQSWSSQTTDDPARATAPGATSTMPNPTTAAAPGRGGRGGLAVVLAALVALALLVWALLSMGGSSSPKLVPEDTNSASPTGPVWNEKSATPSAPGSSPAPSNGAMVDCPTLGGMGSKGPINGQLRGGGLVATEIPGWDSSSTFTLPWTQDLSSQSKTIYSYNNGSGAWFSVSAVGALPKGEGFIDPKVSAEQMMSCFATSSYYSDFTGRKDLVSEAVTVSGHKGWHLRAEVTVDMPELPQVQGDVIDVVVVDTGSATTLGTYVSSATIGDDATLAQVDEARKGLQVG